MNKLYTFTYKTTDGKQITQKIYALNFDNAMTFLSQECDENIIWNTLKRVS